MKQPEIIVGDGAAEHARRYARFGKTDWIFWVGKDEVPCAAKLTSNTIKQAMLATGTQKRFMLYEGKMNGNALIIWWWAANNIRRQLLRQGK